MKFEYEKIEYSLLRILEAFPETWTNSEVEEVCHFLEHGEYGVALETLCAIIEEEDKEIPLQLYNHIRKLGKKMDMNPEVWQSLEGHVSDQGESRSHRRQVCEEED